MTKMYELNQLHITILKTKPRNFIDGSEILNKYKNFEISNLKINTLELSARFKKSANGYY